MEKRLINHALEIYLRKRWVITVFAIPFLLSALLLLIVPAPTYAALGALYLRTGSIPDLNIWEAALTVAVYAVALFISSDAAVNIAVVVKTQRTLTKITSEIIENAKKYASKIFIIYTLALFILTVAQILLYDHPLKAALFALVSGAVAFALFFTLPAVVIDELGVGESIKQSLKIGAQKWREVLIWAIAFTLLLAFLEALLLHLPSPWGTAAVFLINALIITPFFIVLQMQIYMEKYPLAR